MPGLPPGYRARPVTADDTGEIHRLVAACERELFGRVQTDLGRVAADFARPGLVPELDTRLIHDRAGQLVARAWVNRRSEVDVHPEHRGRGLGSALLAWAETRAGQAGSATMQRHAVVAGVLLERLCFEVYGLPQQARASVPAA